MRRRLERHLYADIFIAAFVCNFQHGAFLTCWILLCFHNLRIFFLNLSPALLQIQSLFTSCYFTRRSEPFTIYISHDALKIMDTDLLQLHHLFVTRWLTKAKSITAWIPFGPFHIQFSFHIFGHWNKWTLFLLGFSKPFNIKCFLTTVYKHLYMTAMQIRL